MRSATPNAKDTKSTFSQDALGLAVKTVRERLNITANELAARTGITPSSLSRTENGVRMLALDEAANVSTILGITVQELMDLAIALEKSGVLRQHNKAKEAFQQAAQSAIATVETSIPTQAKSHHRSSRPPSHARAKRDNNARKTPTRS